MKCSWSPFHELQPNPPLRHGHAISIDMAYTATLALDRGMLPKEDHTRLLKLFSRAGLSIDHPLYNDDVIEKGTAAILKTRDGALRLAVPAPLGECKFVNEYTDDDLKRVLKLHKKHTAQYPREGAGLEAFVDSSDMGEGFQAPPKDGPNGHVNGVRLKPTTNGRKGPVQDVHQEKSGSQDIASEGLLNGRHVEVKA